LGINKEKPITMKTYYNFNIAFESNEIENVDFSVAANSCASAIVKAHDFAASKSKSKCKITYVNFHNA
jgi:hypothetical protein